MRIVLRPAQMEEALFVGRERQRLNEGRRDAHNLKESKALRTHLEGAVAEYAYGAAEGILPYWAALNRESGGPDYFDFIDVKGTKHAGGHFLLYPSAPDAWAYVCVTYPRPPAFEVVGWLWGAEAKDPLYWREGLRGAPAYWVPQSQVRPLEELRAAKPLLPWGLGGRPSLEVLE